MTDRALRHSWPKAFEPGYRSIHGSEYTDGNSRTERACAHCGLVKITVHDGGGRSWREWRRPGETRAFRSDKTPLCLVGPTLREFSEVKAL